MRNLLNANLWRMARSKAFWLALLAELAYTALIVLVCWDHYAAGGYNASLESILSAGFGLMGYLPVPSLILAPLLSLHLGTEYTDKTIRNKLVAGRTRTEIYLSDLAACVLTALALDILYLVLAAALCVHPVLGMAGSLLRVPLRQMAAWIAVGLLARTAYVSCIKLLSVACGSRTTLSITAILLVVAASLFCAYCFREIQYLAISLEEPARDARLALWQLMADTLPTGQYLQISRLDTPRLWRMPLMSLLVAAVTTGTGLALFRRQNIK